MQNVFFVDITGKSKFESLWSGSCEILLVSECRAYVNSIKDFSTHLLDEVKQRDPKAFWDARKLQYPTLYEVMMRFLSISLSIAPAESAFSVLNYTDATLRRNMKDEYRDLEHFLSVNRPRTDWNLPK